MRLDFDNLINCQELAYRDLRKSLQDMQVGSILSQLTHLSQLGPE
jgi:hypothetical protein